MADKKLLLVVGFLVVVGFALLVTGQFKFMLISSNISPPTATVGSELFNVAGGQEFTLSCPATFNSKQVDFCFLATSIQPQSNTGSAIITDPTAYAHIGTTSPTPAGQNFACIWDIKKQEFLLSRPRMPEVVALFAPTEQYTIKNVCDISTGFTFRYVQYEASVLSSEKYVIPIDNQPTTSVGGEPIPSVDGIVRVLPVETTSFGQLSQPITSYPAIPMTQSPMFIVLIIGVLVAIAAAVIWFIRR